MQKNSRDIYVNDKFFFILFGQQNRAAHINFPETITIDKPLYSDDYTQVVYTTVVNVDGSHDEQTTPREYTVKQCFQETN